jgi:hypothetical protein
MQIKTPFEHVALLSLMMVKILTKRLQELDQLDKATITHLHHLVVTVKAHADFGGGHELDVLLGELERDLRTDVTQGAEATKR